MSFIIVIGPSKAGKSTLCRAISENLSYDHIDLDQLRRDKSAAKFLKEDFHQLIDTASTSNKLQLIDVGSQFLIHHHSFDTLKPYQERVILVDPGPNVLYERNFAYHQGSCTVEEYASRVYGFNSDGVYKMVSDARKFVSSDDLEADTKRFAELISTIPNV